jgi:collagenase-like PrtC family protease
MGFRDANGDELLLEQIQEPIEVQVHGMACLDYSR